MHLERCLGARRGIYCFDVIWDVKIDAVGSRVMSRGLSSPRKGRVILKYGIPWVGSCPCLCPVLVVGESGSHTGCSMCIQVTG